MYDISKFSMTDMIKCGSTIRRLGGDASSMERVADEIVRFLHENLVVGPQRANACVLARLFKTHDYAQLPANLQRFADGIYAPETSAPNYKCMTLLGTSGENPEWNDRRNSKGHQAIPLPSRQVIVSFPMISNLISQMGLDIRFVIRPDPTLINDMSLERYNVFCVPEAEGSAYIPRQDEFVKPYGVKSVFGFGGVLASGNVFVVILFTKTRIDKSLADMFNTLALNVKMALLPFEDKVFDDVASSKSSMTGISGLHMKSRGLEELLDVTESSFLDRASRLELANEELREVNQRLSDEMAAHRKSQSQLQKTQSQLLQSEKMAAIGQLAAGVAHEINNPVGFVKSNLGTMLAYADTLTALSRMWQEIRRMLDDGDLDGVKQVVEKADALWEREDIDYILDDINNLLAESIEGAERVREIVMNLKSFARADDDERENVDLNECVEATLKIVWNELKYKCEVKKTLNPLPLIACNAGQINQVLMNLLINAAQAIEEKGTVTIETRSEDDAVVVEVFDTGKGIPSEAMDKIFEPFFTTKEVGVGTGLGLSISHGIVTSHGGKIEVESDADRGTRFTIRLPISGGDDGR